MQPNGSTVLAMFLIVALAGLVAVTLGIVMSQPPPAKAAR